MIWEYYNPSNNLTDEINLADNECLHLQKIPAKP